MSHSEAIRRQIKPQPAETPSEFLLRYTGMRTVGQDHTLLQWVRDVAVAGAENLPEREYQLLWGDTLYQVQDALRCAVTATLVEGAPVQPLHDSAVQLLVNALAGHQETLRAVRMQKPAAVAGIKSIDPEALALLIMQDLQNAFGIYEKHQGREGAGEGRA